MEAQKSNRLLSVASLLRCLGLLLRLLRTTPSTVHSGLRRADDLPAQQPGIPLRSLQQLRCAPDLSFKCAPSHQVV